VASFRARLASWALVAGTAVGASALPALAQTDPLDWYTRARSDVLNFQTTGPQGDYWTVSNLMGGVGWNNSTISTQLASVAYRGQYVPQDNSLARGGDDTWTCSSHGCRNHSRLWGIPYRNSKESIHSVSTEHCPPGCVQYLTYHIVDSFNAGRDGLFWDMWPLQWVRSGGWYARYNGGTIRQPDGTSAPFDGKVAYQCIKQNGYCSALGAGRSGSRASAFGQEDDGAQLPFDPSAPPAASASPIGDPAPSAADAPPADPVNEPTAGGARSAAGARIRADGPPTSNRPPTPVTELPSRVDAGAQGRYVKPLNDQGLIVPIKPRPPEADQLGR